jgi:uncharacterized protein YyaL (SSP411 family)
MILGAPMADTDAGCARNRLAGETSPYLLQHAANPVDWWPWGPEALAEAQATGKPILLSIGYSACHWCHVMAEESFADEATARLMNTLFVNVKVDREERPDLDRIYQLAHHLLTRRGGGWPLTMFLDPRDQRPFFGGTYFPREARGPLPPFRAVLERVAAFHRERRDELVAQGDALVATLEQIEQVVPETGGQLDAAPLAVARRALEDGFDREHGGWGEAPKFPHPESVLRLLRTWQATARTLEPDLMALYLATLTLRRMADGGVFDQLGGGFFRYSTDAAWQVPHFEKMLCDNGALLSAYADAHLATGDERYAEVTAATGEFLLREMRSPEGGFHTAIDADAGGEEGRYYVWTRAEVDTLLGTDEARLFCARHGLDAEPNFEDSWQLRIARELDDLAASGEFGSSDAPQLAARLAGARERLLAARALRLRPATDDKHLTGWNALAIRGLADAARVLQRPDFGAAATEALAFLRRCCWDGRRLAATFQAGRARHSGSLDDHAFTIDAVLALQELRVDARELDFARALAERLLEGFEEPQTGGFWYTASDHEPLFHRSRSFSDEATPSGNGIAARALRRLGLLLGEPRYVAAAERTLRAGHAAAASLPLAHMSLLTALDEALDPPIMVVLRGEFAAIEEWRTQLQRLYLPRVAILAVPAELTGLPDSLASKPAADRPVAYVCRGETCSAPLFSLAQLRDAVLGKPAFAAEDGA